jgi:exopolysaccharide production protein ExoZ
MKQDRLDNVQLLRGIAATSVICEHAFDQFSNHPIAAMPILHSPIGSVWGNGVDIFFVISGFIMYYLSHDHFADKGYPAEFLKRRIVRVVPTYWLFTTMMVLAAVLRPDTVNNGTGSPWHLISSYLFIPSPRPDGLMHPVLGLGWTLNYEMFFYACYTIALFFPARLGLSVLIGSFAAFACLHLWMPEGILSFWTAPIILEFVAGMVIAMVFVRGIRIRPIQAALLFAAGILLSLILPLYIDESARIVRSGLPSALLAAALMLAPNRRWPAWAILIGDASYALYLSHPFSLNVVTGVWRTLHLPLNGYLYWATLIIASLAAGALLYISIERPIMRLLRKYFEPKRNILAA